MVWKIVNILQEFEKRYRNDPSETMQICTEIAKEFGLDAEKVADYVYINRYETDPIDPIIEEGE